MLEQLPLEVREPLGHDIGEAIYAAIIDPRSQLLVDKYQDDENAIHYLKAGTLYLLTGEERWLAGEANDNKFDNISPLDLLEKRISDGEYPGVASDPETLQAVREKASDLLCEAIDDCVFWFAAITVFENPSPDLDYLVSHPTIASAISLNDTVHRTAKSLLVESLKRGKPFKIPKTHADFVRLFHEAPELFSRMGLKFVIDTDEQRDPSQRGLCPAATKDESNNTFWHKELAKLVAPIHLRRLV